MHPLHERIVELLAQQLPSSRLKEIEEKGTWLQRVLELRLEHGQELILKLAIHPEWCNPLQEAMKCDFLRQHGIPVPNVIAVDESCALLPQPFILQEKLPGKRLQHLLLCEDKQEQQQIYRSIGETYRKLHSIHNDRSGLMGDTPHETRYPVAPNNYMFQAEIVEGSGRQALEQGLISADTHQRIVQIWTDNLDYLNAHQPSLVHNSCFPWTISLKNEGNSWSVSKMMALGDFLWWDPAYDIALLQYPIFYEMSEVNWHAFIVGYGDIPERKRILLYRLMQLLCAAMGVYMEPAELKKTPISILEQLEPALDELASL